MFGIRASENIGRRASKRLSARTFLGAFGDMITLSPVDGIIGARSCLCRNKYLAFPVD
jgi:hypothetical protein